MATRGRKPKPTAMKELEGNPGKHPLNTSEPKPNKKAPACPKWLEPEAKKEWRRLAKQMEAIGILTEVDMAAFAGYCQAYVPGLGFNGLIGFSPIAMMKNSLGTSIAVDKYGSSFFKNGAQPSGVLEHPGVVKDPNRIRDSWEAAYGGAANAHRVAVLEEGMAYKPISLPPEDSQFLETKQFSVTEICRIFRVPPHLVADLSRATFSNIEYQSLNFVMHSLTPWLVRIEQGIIKDLLLEEEQDTYFPKFNVDGLLRGDYQSRMNGYATGISNGFLSPNDVHRLENMDLIPAEEGGDDYYLNGGYVKLKNAGVAQQNKAAAVQQNQPKQTQPEEQDLEEEPDSDNRLSESKPRKNERRRTR